jgi:flavin-dependent dehydrogenase
MTRETTGNIGSSRSYDAIVVGARPAGAATAMLLGRADKRVLLVDRAVIGGDTLSTHALMRGGVMQLQRWGLLDEIRDAPTPAIRRTHFHYGDEVVEIGIREQFGVDALYAPRRTVLDPVLVEAARAAGVEVVDGLRVTGLRRDAMGLVVGVVGALAAGVDAIADAEIVVGADGMASTIASLVDAPNTYDRTDASAYIYGYFPGLPNDLYDWHFRPGLMGGVVPTNGVVANVSVGMTPDRFASVRTDGVEPVFRAALREVAPDVARQLERVPPVGRFRSFPGRPGHLRRAYGAGWALVGDAGSWKDPITAHGITDALRDAELLVRSLLSTGNAAAYEATRDLFARPFLDLTTTIAAYGWDLPQLKALHRDLKLASDEEHALLAGLDGPRSKAA